MLQSLSGKSVIVTGSSKGIGKGIASVFARQGVNVLVVSRHEDEAKATAGEMIRLGAEKAEGVAVDVTNFDDCRAMAQRCVDEFGSLDILCANAGIFPQTSMERMEIDEWDFVINTNLRSSFYSVKACLEHMKSNGWGRVVLTSSITGPITGFPGWTHYGASKSGQLGFMRSACMELARYDITVNAVLPGNIMTEGLEELGDDHADAMSAAIPLKRLGTVEDIGYAALFFASQEASYITGQTIVVDGGQTIPESTEALDEM